MAEKYNISTVVLQDLWDESPGQIRFDPDVKGKQMVSLNTWQYDMLLNHVEEKIYSGTLHAYTKGQSYKGALIRLEEKGPPYKADKRLMLVPYTVDDLQPYPDFDGTQNCAGLDMYPEHNQTAAKVAREVCPGCPFFDECRNWGIHHEEYGIWGGLQQSTRAAIRKEQGIKLMDPYLAAVYSG